MSENVRVVCLLFDLRVSLDSVEGWYLAFCTKLVFFLSFCCILASCCNLSFFNKVNSSTYISSSLRGQTSQQTESGREHGINMKETSKF